MRFGNFSVSLAALRAVPTPRNQPDPLMSRRTLARRSARIDCLHCSSAVARP